MKLLSDAGLLVFIATEENRKKLVNKYGDDYFCINKTHLFISRKGTQHRKTRRRSRLRKAANAD